jgi:hypothetical protein
VRIKVIGPMVSILISLFAIAIVVILTWQSISHHSYNPMQVSQDNKTASPEVATTKNPAALNMPDHLIANPTQEMLPSKTPTLILTLTIHPTATQNSRMTSTPDPTPTIAVSATPDIIRSGYNEICDPMIYEGIHRCMKGPYHVVKVDPKNPHVRFEVVLPMGYDRYGNYGECRDVQLPDSVQPGESTGPGCFMDHSYPAERVEQMARRYDGAVIAFNGDFFSPSYAFGAMGLTVKNGQRLDGNPNDREGREVRRSSLSISIDGDIRIGTIPLDQVPNPGEPWNWTPDPAIFYQTIGGLPMLVRNGHPVDLHEQCIQEQGWCPDQYYPRARTAVGKTFDDEMIIVVVPEEWGLTIEGLAHLMVELGCEEAINLDGGGSSQLWYDGSYLYYSSRAVAQSVIVISEVIDTIGEGPGAVIPD